MMSHVSENKNPAGLQCSAFPLIRQLSALVTPWLVKTPITANQITFISMVLGLTASFLFSLGTFTTDLFASILFSISYLLDHCDGEVARGKNQASKFGQNFDSFVDWIVHTTFFIGLGWGTYTASSNIIWVWFGVAAAFGATINYLIGIYLLIKRNHHLTKGFGSVASPELLSDIPESLKDKVIFAFRELARADFWLLVFLLAIFGFVWILLPAAAIGAQIYWITLLLVGDKNFRV